MKFAKIIIDINNKNVDKVFDYIIPENLKYKIKIGMRAYVPFGKSNKIREGYIVDLAYESDINENLLKKIHSLPDNYNIVDKSMINLAKFMSNKYYCTLSNCLQCIMPKIVNDKTLKYICLNNELFNFDEEFEKILNKNNQQSKILNFLKNINAPISINELKSFLGITNAPINSLEKKGLIKLFEKEFKRDVFDISKYENKEALFNTKEQENAINFIKKTFDNEIKKPILLYGVTGSGKTEVYLKIIEDIISKGKQAIMLVPEISLTPQTVERFIARFGKKVSVTHSKLSDGERFDQWKKAKFNEISIMIGTRSAIFTPFENLGIVIIDEEHDFSYKSETTPKYSTIEIAEELCKIKNSILLLGSATPSITSYYKTQKNEYDLIKMKTRVNKKLPKINIIDMRKELENNNKSIFSKDLFNAIKNNLENKMQTILFLNRRGHSTFISCRKCGYVAQCENCNVNYVYHLSENKLKCHYCNNIKEIPKVCPECNSNYIKYFGIGTQKIEDETKKYFPNAKILRMDLDTTSKKNSHQIILEKFKNNEADILIGTQMISKGLDFPNVSLVGVIAADLILNTGDYKSAENYFQIINQVSGRAGRGNTLGTVYIQTYSPEHYCINFLKENDYENFYLREIQERKINFYPPFSNIFLILFLSKNEEKVLKCIYKLNEIMLYYNKKTNFQISEPSKAIISKINNFYRYKIIIKADEEERLKNFVLFCIERLKLHINIDDIIINLSLNPNFIQ